ncbi:MAG: 30S ribosomal protein S9 [Methanophagales archaeon]|nr:30S ribosomal protein S9 [Methanophagales archaeon]MCW7069861.1 30S ribosomal protein S9 [Methanophagales archaeon]MCW7072948.1 30S ribosomal protein S9 [Methanophagales archaeon]RLG35907.1 MAG: 30S ribosomal protein S9 [Methanosarcinales archaeon]
MGTKAKVKRIVNQTGKRKRAIARVTIKEGKGDIRINKKPLAIIEPEVVRAKISEPLFIASQLPEVAPEIENINVEVNVRGGGFMGQAEAARTAIARGLVDWTCSEKLKEMYLDYDRTLLVSDVRQKESKKAGAKGARAHRQKSYR